MNNLRLIGVLCLSVFLSPTLHADDNQETQSPPPQSMEYVDNAGVVHQYGDGFGNIISREQFVKNVENGQRLVADNALRTQHEASNYLKTASPGEDSEITQSVIKASDQAIKDVKEMSENAIHQAESLKPKSSVYYEKPKVLVSQ